MNYIRHLSGFFIRLAGDQRITPYHISLYLALFQQWNAERFGDQFVISRSEMMQLSRIGSTNTYARCMKELEDWGYISYTASSNFHLGSRVSCIRFDVVTDTTSNAGNDTARNTTSDTGTETGKASGIGNDTGRNIGTSSNTESDTGIKTDTTTNTGDDTIGNTDTSNDLRNDTASSTAGDTGITANIKPDTGRNTVNKKNDPAGLITDIGCDTASDTLLINITNRNKQEENRETRDQKDDLDQKEKNQKQIRGINSENLPEEKLQAPNLIDVEQFFEKNQFPRSEAQKFYHHYQSAGWKTGNKMKILSWQAVARKWMINAQRLKNDEREPNQSGTSKLSVTVNKDYSEPL